MAWQSTMVIFVRQLINDLGTTEEYDDARIEEAIAVGAMIAINEFPFDTEYVIDLETPDITPDPTTSYDPLAIALFSLKAACILDTGRVQQSAAKEGILVRDGDSVVDTKGLTGKGYSLLLQEGACGTYKKLLETNYWKTAGGQGVGIFGPYGNDTAISNGFNDTTIRGFFDYYLRY